MKRPRNSIVLELQSDYVVVQDDSKKYVWHASKEKFQKYANGYFTYDLKHDSEHRAILVFLHPNDDDRIMEFAINPWQHKDSTEWVEDTQ